ncbi:hypothetical protein ACIQEY_34555 [Streptomyces parvus]|uniref:hypothetical protein n=1 Tax=Streptomyces parvus TaxID=66428 RepID=UPI00382CF86B
MSVSEQLFIKTSLSREKVAKLLCRTLRMELQEKSQRFYLITSEKSSLPARFGGEIQANRFSTVNGEADDVQAFDGYPIVFRMRSTASRAEQVRSACEVARKVAEFHDWPLMLIHDLDLLVARWSPEDGWQKFPPGTSPDIEDIELWGEGRSK